VDSLLNEILRSPYNWVYAEIIAKTEARESPQKIVCAINLR
jgi:hypothetical protein